MATVQDWLLENRLADKGSDINLMKIVGEPTWKDILVELVRRNKIDPWNIDIVDVVDKYIEAVKEMKTLDLRVPANIILAASILLRLKSEMLVFDDVNGAIEGEGAIARPHVELPGLELRLRVPPKRRVTLEELISALEEAIKLKEIKETTKMIAPIEIPLKFDDIDIEQEAESLYDNIKLYADKSKMVTFSNMLSILNSKDALLELFIPMLFLASKGRIGLLQEKFFEEIIIVLAG